MSMCKAKVRPKEELLSVAEEIAFARALAANDQNLRARALKKLRKWFLLKSNQDSRGLKFTEEGFMRIWKGLFYNVWMSDKPLAQEECVESISQLVHCFNDLEEARKFIRCFFQSISQAWFGLDGHRMDKYLMLVRRFLRQVLEYLYNLGWEEEKVDLVCEDFAKALQLAPIGLNLHITEIYLEELAKVGRGELGPHTVTQMIKPFADYMAISSDTRVFKYVNNFIFLHLLRQSDEGIKYGAKFEVWKEMGFPEGDIDVIQETSEDELEGEMPDIDMDEDDDGDDEMTTDSSKGPLDPRAGNVDVLLPPLDFDPKDIKDYLNSLARKKDTTTKARNAISFLSKKYEKFIEGKYPLGIHKVEVPEIEDQDKIIEQSAQDLLNEDKAFVMEKHAFKKKKRVSFNSWEISPVEDIDLCNAINEFANRGRWVVKKAVKRKSETQDQEKEPIGSTMKKVKVTLDESLLNLSTEENNEEVCLPSEIPEEPENVIITIKKNHKGNPLMFNSLRADNFPREVLMKDGIPTKLEILRRESIMLKIHKRTPKAEALFLQRVQKADRDWGISSNQKPQENEEDIIIPFTPDQSKKVEKKSDSSTMSDDEATQDETSISGKKVAFALSKNTVQEVKEYKKALKLSPNIPFDIEKKPPPGVLKPFTVRSPINPFYKYKDRY